MGTSLRIVRSQAQEVGGRRLGLTALAVVPMAPMAPKAKGGISGIRRRREETRVTFKILSILRSAVFLMTPVPLIRGPGEDLRGNGGKGL